MSDGSTTSKKNRSTSDAERRQRRAQRILNSADSRLRKITATYTLSTEPTSSTGTSPLTSRKSSPQPSQKSSPITSESPESPFTSRRNTGNLEPLPDYLVEPTVPTPNQSTSLSTPSIQLPPISPDEDSNESLSQDDDYIRKFLENLQVKNSSTTSLESSGGTSEFQYYPSASIHPLTIMPEDSAVQEILQSQQIPPFPFTTFFPFNFPSSGGGQQQSNLQSKLWQLIHFSTMILLALIVVYRELLSEDDIWNRFSRLGYSNPDDITGNETVYSVPLFWYFVTVELVLQSSRLFLQKDRTFQGSTLGSLAASLPSPFSDVLKILLRYKLIWNSLWEDICILVFVVGFTIMISPILSIFGK